MELLQEDMTTLIVEIWSAVADLNMTPAGGAPVADGSRADDTLTGFVHIDGAWQGTVTLECPRPLAALAAASMFGMKVDELAVDEIQDCLGELASMTGGGVKALLPGPSQLSLPTVVEGDHYRVTVPGSEELSEVRLQCGDDVIAVRVLHRPGTADADGSLSDIDE